ncbi:MAG TPA: beta-ketoacyl-[acyl-carrier-protein] synthase II [Nitrospirae bacterium]|nr:3-oxoacyl-[acyl-carrier-protein] synthase 2 [bacterium BMS3Bbin09]HDH34706.1 beta-ketoacyl-[acyl-carrier-protein] synthase II [Nitrospirota bacterium]HDN95329.1 beta-ketoacyl-[acyl-carrier-protein] synthase II [Nitrospirota bacterium]HDZ83846.1 beta-ketoacyl-[acyl-carrier-protein] synthase II [Nitrospirota bacterium]
MKKVVITGIGAVTPLGNTIQETWENLLQKRSGISQITRFDPSGLPSRIAGELKGFSAESYISRKDILRLDPFIHYATAAADMALEDAGLKTSGDLRNAGVVVGSSRGGITSLETALEKHLLKNRPFSAYLMSSSTINMASSHISMKFGIKGPSLGISTACASGTNAIGEAVRMIRHSDIDIVIAGGSEAPICRIAVGGYGASGSLSKRNHESEKASRPFDNKRDGFVIAEGAGILVLESLDHALKRGVRIYAEISGYGMSSDAFHMTQPNSEGEVLAIQNALVDANIRTNEVDYINAHATSTKLGDSAETEAVKKVFGEQSSNIQISSCKSMLGHMLGAAGAVETAVTALSISNGIITPTINLEEPDPDCDLNYATSAINRDIEVSITNSFGFGGANAVLVLRKIQPSI